MTGQTDYDSGYASIDANRRVGANALGVNPALPTWGQATIKLHLGWLSRQLRINPRDEFRWGRYDALCDLLVRFEPLAATGEDSPLQALKGLWSRSQ
ncbi:MAG: hypothetical protein ACREFO_06975 [Acetobacteraceae bacterium]